jgi:hypothetical protein
MRPQPGISELAHHSLMHHWFIRLDTKHIFAKFDSANMFTGLIVELCFHYVAPSILITSFNHTYIRYNTDDAT